MARIVSTNPPQVKQGRLSWHASMWLLSRLDLLSTLGGSLTLVDSFGTPGDTLLTGTVARLIREKHPHLRINVVTPNPELLEHDPNICTLNAQPSLVVLRFWYLEIIHQKNGSTNLLAPTLGKVGIQHYAYQSRVWLTPAEVDWARQKTDSLRHGRPLLSINVQSREKVKVWGLENWHRLVQRLTKDFHVVHLGGPDEPVFDGVRRLAGELTMRQSMAVLSQCQVFVGPVSFLMHAANGLDVPSVILYGGRETPANSGYVENLNLYVPMPCGPCWLHDSRGDVCPHDIECMTKISVDEVETAVRKQLQLSAR